jgi:hypothetical protein
MKQLSFFIISFIILFIVLAISVKHKEGFLDTYCTTNTNCTDCANSSGCSWCPTNNVCLSSTSLKTTDKKCNQYNVVSSAFKCKMKNGGGGGDGDGDGDGGGVDGVDFDLYKNQIADKIPPPNVFTSSQQQYSPETVVADVNNLRMEFDNYRKEFPDIIASTVQDQIKPMVKGVLAENYYIQG